MNSVVVMVTVSERVHMLNNFLESLGKFGATKKIIIHMQGENVRDQIVIPEGVSLIHYMWSSERMGCHAARVRLLDEVLHTQGMAFDAYVNVDDDVELNRYTNWQPAIDKTQEPGVGFVLTNWVKHINAMPAAIKRMEDKFYPQIMLYQGGGMAYSHEVAELMAALPAVPARYDDLWPLTAYLEGYKSYRYQGSLAVHRIMVKGGMNSYMKAEPRPLLCWDWINYRPLNGQPVGSEYSIPMDSDLKKSARECHKKARAEKGWA